MNTRAYPDYPAMEADLDVRETHMSRLTAMIDRAQNTKLRMSGFLDRWNGQSPTGDGKVGLHPVPSGHLEKLIMLDELLHDMDVLVEKLDEIG